MDWSIDVEGDEPIVKHRHNDDDWSLAKVLMDPIDRIRYADCACGAQMAIDRQPDGWTLRPR
jgi:hypothetical protein